GRGAGLAARPGRGGGAGAALPRHPHVPASRCLCARRGRGRSPDHPVMKPADANLLVAGVDEAGRGPLAGPVVVAAVILRAGHALDGLDDSKRLSEARREALYPQILEAALAWRVEFVDTAEIDALNILQATLAGMCRALRALSPAAQPPRARASTATSARATCPARPRHWSAATAWSRRSWPPRSWPRSPATAPCANCTWNIRNTVSTATRAIPAASTWPRCRRTGRAHSTGAASGRSSSAFRWPRSRPDAHGRRRSQGPAISIDVKACPRRPRHLRCRDRVRPLRPPPPAQRVLGGRFDGPHPAARRLLRYA